MKLKQNNVELKAVTATKPVVKPKRTRKKIEPEQDGILIKEVCDRRQLHEGRTSGMGFAFLKKVGEKTFETVQPLSPCKDYLAEPVTTEWCGIGTRAYGLTYTKKLNIFSDVAYMAVEMMETISGYFNYVSSFRDEAKLLKENHKHIQNFLNQIEEKLEFPLRTIIEKANDNRFLVTLPVEWCRSSISISLYTLLMRVTHIYEGKEDFMTFLEHYSYHGEDRTFLKQAIPKLKLIIENKKLPPNRNAYKKEHLLTGSHRPHDQGIISWDISDPIKAFEEVEITK